MHGYIVRLDQLGFGMDNELSIDLILVGLPDSFAQFMLNYRMNDKETTILELICRPSILPLNTCIYPMGVTLTHRSHITPLGPF